MKKPPAAASSGHRRASVTSFARTIDPKREARIKEIFSLCDENNDGSLTRQELRHVFQRLDLHTTDQSFDALFSALDRNGDGIISLEEFMGGFKWLRKSPSFYQTSTPAPAKKPLRKHSSISEFVSGFSDETGKELFSMCDKDGDGQVTAKELLSVMQKDLHMHVGKEEFEALWQALDENHDGRVNEQEFLHAIHWFRAAHHNDEHNLLSTEQKLSVVIQFCQKLLQDTVDMAQRAADKDKLKTAHSILQLIDMDALSSVEEFGGTILLDKKRKQLVHSINSSKTQ